MEFSFWFRILKFRIFEFLIQSIFDSIFYIYFILCLWKDLRFSNSDVSTNTVICSYIHVTYSSIWGGVRLEFFFFNRILVMILPPKIHPKVVKEAKLSVIHIRKFLITKEKWVCLSEIQQKKNKDKIHWNALLFSVFCSARNEPLRTSLWEWFYFDDPSNYERPVTNNKKYNNWVNKNYTTFCISIFLII